MVVDIKMVERKYYELTLKKFYDWLICNFPDEQQRSMIMLAISEDSKKEVL